MDNTNKDKAIQDAYRLLKSGNYQEARTILIQLVKENPNIAEAWYLLGLTLTDPQQQVYAFKQVLRINPSNEYAKKQIALIEDKDATPVHINQGSIANKPKSPAKTSKSSINSTLLFALVCISAMLICVLGIGVWFLYRNGYFTNLQAVIIPSVESSPTFNLQPTFTYTPIPSITPRPTNTPTLFPTKTSQPEIPITSLVIPTEILRSLALSYLNTEMWCGEIDIQSIEYQNEKYPNLLSTITVEQSTTQAWDGTLLGSVPCNDSTLREISLQIYLLKWPETTDMKAASGMVASEYANYSKSRLPDAISASGVQLPQDTQMLKFVDGTDGGAPKTLVLITHRNNVTIVGILLYPLMYDRYSLDELLAGYVITQYSILQKAGY